MKKFSFYSIFVYYSVKDLIQDIIIPVIVATGLCLFIHISSCNIAEQLDKLVALGLDIVPAMVALLFSAYAIIITFFADKVFQSIKEKPKGKQLINTLNATFCLYLLVLVFGVLIMLLTSILSGLNLESDNATRINYIAYWIISFLLTYSVVTLFGIILDIYYCGKATLL